MTDNIIETKDVAGKAEIKVRPTLFIACGGTGMEILLRLRRRILNADWVGTRISSLSKFPVAAFLYVDVDTAEARERSKSKRTDPLATQVIFDPADEVKEVLDIRKYTRSLGRYPLVKEWLPKEHLDKIDVEKGAGQVRPISRLYFFDHAKQVKDLILQKCKNLEANVSIASDLAALGLKEQKDVRIVIVGSTAGGTGSGMFLDMGYLARSAKPEAQVDLIYLLGGGFEKHNMDRVRANTYSAMMELEYCMRGNRYVERWTDDDKGVPDDIAPFSEVYLLDTTNMARESTKNVEDIYDMVADVFFEDFGSGEFATEKRSVAVNQKQFKLSPYDPPMGEELGGNPLVFSRVYSSFGQATLDTQSQAIQNTRIVEAGIEMVRSFFRVAEDDQRNTPRPEELTTFLEESMGASVKHYDGFPKDMPERITSVRELQLVEMLLRRETGKSILAEINESVNRAFDLLPQNKPERADWPDEIEKIKRHNERIVFGETGSPDSAVFQKEIEERRRKICEEFFGEGEGGLKKKLYNRLDDKVRGGLAYTIALVGQIKDAIDNESTGAIKTLREAEKRYLELADMLLNNRYLPSIDRLKDTFGMDLIGSKKRAAEVILQQTREDLIFRLQYYLRAKACAEAVTILGEVSIWLGEKQMDDKGEFTGTGLVREFLEGRSAVRDTIELLNLELKRLEAHRNRNDAMYMILEGEEQVATPFDSSKAAEWAQEAFDGLGGSQGLFLMLNTKEGRSEIVNRLLGYGKQHLFDEKKNENSMFRALSKLTVNQQKEIFKNLLARAMPWLDAKVTGHFGRSFRPDQYEAFLAVKGVEQYRHTFDAILKDAVPSIGGIPERKVKFVESGVDGRIICYIEISGIPLDVIEPLKTVWRSSYNMVLREALPLHNHKDGARFPHPVVPDEQEIKRMRRELQLFLEAVALGVLRRRSDEERLYEGESEPGSGEWLSIGSERGIRSIGFTSAQYGMVEDAVRRKVDELTGMQLLALSVLFSDMGTSVYRQKRVEIQGGGEIFVQGLGCILAKSLTKIYEERALNSMPREAMEAQKKLLGKKIIEWTIEIPGSRDDVDSGEVGQDAKAKRTVRREFFTPGWLEKIAGPPGACKLCGIEIPSTSQYCSRCDPGGPSPHVSVYVVVNGQQAGPFDINTLRQMAKSGQLTRDSLVWMEGMGSWASASTVATISGVFGATPPPLPPPLPPA